MKRSELKRSPMPSRKSRIRSVNPEKRARRRKGYTARLARADWKVLRLERFTLDDFTCRKCGGRDETETGDGLHCAHRTYARFGHELITDLATECERCHLYDHALEGKRIRP